MVKYSVVQMFFYIDLSDCIYTSAECLIIMSKDYHCGDWSMKKYEVLCLIYLYQSYRNGLGKTNGNQNS